MDGLEENNKNQCLELSTKIWLILYQEDSDAGFEFEIFNANRLILESSEILERGARVKVERDNFIIQAIVVAVSDDLKYLEEIFPTVTGDFLNTQPKEYKKVNTCNCIKTTTRFRDMASQTEDVKSPFISSIEEILYNRIPNYKNPENLTIEKDLLEEKYQELDRILKDFKGSIKIVLTETETAEFPETSNSIPNVLTSLNKTDINSGQKETTSKNIDPDIEEDENKYVCIGKNKTLILKDIFDSIQWKSYTTVTRRLLTAVFPRHVLATHSLTGKPSPAFIGANKKVKARLDPLKIADIVEIVCAKCKVSPSMVRSAITTKCADENKMERKRKKT